jgi:DNA-directed RNA polymerase sigma subunit (sigma70/sigma32)
MAEDGWPYSDGNRPGDSLADPTAEPDDDLVAVQALWPHLLDGLDPLERRVVDARIGLHGEPRSMKQIQRDEGMPRAELRLALGSGLAKLRLHLGS